MRPVVVWLLLAAALAAPARLALADIYSFVDRDGVVHYTNVRPAAAGIKRIYHSTDSGEQLAVSRGRLPATFGRRGDPDRARRYDPHIQEAAQLYQLPQAFIRAIVLVESNFYPDAVSQAGAVGLMQLMPDTAASMGVLDPFDPRQNVLGGTRYLRVLANKFNGDLVLTVAAYNAGETVVEKYRGVPPFSETRSYVRNVLHQYYAFRALENALAKR
ncbi:MAG TPA: lytic transglycosylase domain-containing protein [Polyangiales bacterium]